MSDCRFCEWTNGVDMAYENPSDERITQWNQEKIIHLLEHIIENAAPRNTFSDRPFATLVLCAYYGEEPLKCAQPLYRVKGNWIQGKFLCDFHRKNGRPVDRLIFDFFIDDSRFEVMEVAPK